MYQIKLIVRFLLGYNPASEFRWRGMTQKKAHNVQNTVKVSNQEMKFISNLLKPPIVMPLIFGQTSQLAWKLCPHKRQTVSEMLLHRL